MKRMTALLLSVIMMIGMLPVSAVAAGGPSNITWHEGSYLLVTWEDKDAPMDVTYDIIVYHSDSENGPWRQVDYESNWEKDTAYAIQCVQWTGPGYYKVEIRRSDSDVWTESEPYLLILNGTAKHGRIAAPVSGSFDAAGGELSWTDPAEGVDYTYNYSNFRHNAVVRMWYTGENGELDKSQWELHDIYFAWEDTCTINNFSKSGLKSGQYAFSVNNFAEDYCWRGQSTTLILDGRYTYEAPVVPDTPVLDGPTNVMWTENGGVSWTFPEQPVDIEFQLLRSATQPVNDESFTVIWNIDYGYSGSMEEAYALQMELSAVAEAHVMEYGAGFYAFRVRYTSAEGSSDWVWSDLWNNGSSDLAQDAGDLQWNIVHMANGSKSMPGYIAFRAPENALYEVDIRLRTAAGSTSVASWSGRVWDKDFENIDFTGNIAYWQNGTYYFTVQLRNDNGTAGNIVTSPDWVYTAPDKVLQATNLTWNTDDLLLEWETDEELVQWASIEIYYNGSGSDAAGATVVNYAYANEDMESAELGKTLFNNGAGWYWFKVRLESNNVLQAQNSKDEPFSPVFYFADNADKLQVTNPRWTGDGLGMTWDIPVEQADIVDAYNVVLYYSDINEAPDPDTSFWVSQATFSPNDNWKMPNYVLENADRGDGYYFFTVTPMSKHPLLAKDGDRSSISGGLRYNAPELKLNTYNTGWNENNEMVWEVEENFDSALVDRYEVRFYYGKTENSVDTVWPVYYETYYSIKNSYAPPAEMLEQCGEGWYAFEICAYSNDLFAAQTGEWSGVGEAAYLEKVTQPMPAPYDLQWGVERWEDDSENIPGMISFAGTVPEDMEEVSYRVEVYRREASGDVRVARQWGYLDRYSGMYSNVNPFADFAGYIASGTYYFTVTAVGDDLRYVDSATVTSPDWVYTRPATQLTISNPVWNSDMTMSWQNGTAQADYYEIRFQYVGAGETLNPYDWHSSNRWYGNGSPTIAPWMLEQYGNGTYYFQVRAMSNDITKVLHSDWTDWSAPFAYTAPELVLKAEKLKWNEETNAMEWQLAVGDESMVGGYTVQVWWNDEPSDVGMKIGNFDYDADDAPFTLPQWVWNEYGPGYYFFRVRIDSGNPMLALSGQWSNFVKTPLHFAGPEQQAPQATDLQWHVERYDAYDSTAKLGVINFKNPCYDDGQTRTEFKITVFEQLENGNRVVGTLNTRSRNLYVNAYPFDYFPEEMTTGTYYFAVTTVGDKITTSNSEPVVSGTWNYTRPAAQKTISAPVWNDDLSMNWTDGTNPGDSYQIRIQWVGEGGTFYEDNWQSSMTIVDKNEAVPPEWFFTDYGPGTFYFQVRAMSEDITTAVPSDWTDWSAGFEYTEPNKGLITINPDWADGMQMTWTTPANLLPFVKAYEVYFYHSDSPDAEFEQDAWWDWERYMPGQSSYAVPEWLTSNLGNGYYWFRVVALTNDPTQAMGGIWSDMSPAYYLGADGSTLAPTDLQWDTKTGVLSFKNPYYDGDTDSEFRVEVFRKDAAGNVENVGNSNSGTNREYVDWALFENRPNDLLTGEYYFTVYTKAGNGHGQSEKVTSPVWSYTRPEVQLEVSSPVWTEDMKMNWTNGTVLAERYKIRYQFVPAGGTFDAYDYNGSLITDESGNVPVLEKWLEKNGAGTYYFCVMALSDDLTEVVHSEWSDWSAGFEYTGETQQPELPKLSAPTEVHWHKEATWGVTGDSQMVEILIDRTGSVAWTRAKNADGTFADHGEYELEIYDAVTGQCVDNGGIGIGRNSTDTYVDSPNFIYRDLPSGTYYFRVRAVSLDDQHAASDWVTSGTWTYTQPNAMLDTPANLHWNVSTDGNGDPVYVAEWDEVENRGFFDVRFYYAADANSAPQYIGSSRDTRGNSVELPAGKLEKYGDGLYFFTVRAIPEEIEDYQRGNESEMSPALNTREPVKPAISAPAWKNSTTMTWDSDLENVDHYQIQIQYVPAGGTFNPNNWLYSMHWYDGAPAYLEDEFFYNYGSGTYYFRVNACVNQDGSYVYTDYSDWSAGMSYTLPAPNVTAEAYGRYLYVDGFLPEMAGTQYHIAVYSGEGQMLDMLTLDGLSEQAEIDLDSDCPNGAYIRVFTTEGWTPVADVLEANVAIMR